jgi:hypothetical protein
VPAIGVEVGATAGSAASMRSIGSGTPMTPVDITSTSVSATPSSAAVAEASRAVCSSPCGVHTLALPALITIARARPSAACRSVSRQEGALTRLVVVTTAVEASASVATSARSSRPEGFTPLATPPARTPPTAVMPPSTGSRPSREAGPQRSAVTGTPRWPTGPWSRAARA